MGIEKILELAMQDPELALTVVHAYIEQYKPIVYGLCKELAAVYEDYANGCDPICEATAKIRSKAMNAYICNNGFTREEAMALLLNDNLNLYKQMKSTSSKTKVSRSTNGGL